MEFEHKGRDGAKGGGMEFEEKESGRRVTVSFRQLRRGDGEGFRRCIEDFYGEGYPYKEYLEEEFLLEKCASGEMTVLCGVTPDGEMISTSAVWQDEEFRGSALLMLRVVKEAYRGMGIGKVQEECLFRYAERQEGVYSLYADVMTHNSISQGSLARRGFVFCGIRMMLYRNPVMVPGLGLAKEGKMSQAVMCRRGCVHRIGILYCPSEHVEEVRRIYGELGVECGIVKETRIDVSVQADGQSRCECLLSSSVKMPEVEETDMSWKEEAAHNSYILMVQKMGKDFEKRLSVRMEQIGEYGDATVVCYLNLRDLAAVSGYETLFRAGFFFTGLKPLQENAEYMLLTYIGGQKIRYEDIHLHENGEKLLSYIKKHRRSAKRGINKIENNKK